MLELREVPGDQTPGWEDRLVARLSTLRFEKQYDDVDEAARQARETVVRLLADSRILTVVDGDDEVGYVWLPSSGAAVEPLDVHLDDAARADELLPLLIGQARDRGQTSLGIAARPGDDTGAAFVELPGFVARATNMRLVLDGAVDDPAPLLLRPMTGQEFEDFHEVMLADYTRELVSAGMSEEAAQEQSRRQNAELIPDGVDSEGQEFFTAWVDDVPVGRLWLSTQRPMSFVYDVEVRPEHRRRGHGAAIMNAGALWSREHGHFAIGLNVFAHNPEARRLYDRLGYEVTIDFRTIDIPAAD